MNKKLGKRIGAALISFGIIFAMMFGPAVESYAYTQTTGTVSSDNVKVRESASTTAKQVSSLKNGDVIDIVDEATDASGYVWYKIRVNKSEYGYVRSDLIKKAGGSSSSTTSTDNNTSTDSSNSNNNTSTETTTKTTQSNSSAASLPETSVVAVDQKSATVIADSCNVRKGAGTGYDVVGKVTKGTTVTITGEATGTDSKTWYQITFGDKQGFLRSDLLEVGEAAPADTTENTDNSGDAEAPEATEGGDATQESEQTSEEASSNNTGVASEVGDGTFSLVYLTDEEGNGIWYLYDNVQSTRVKVKDLIDVANRVDEATKIVERNKTYRLVIIILSVFVILLIGAVVYLVFKLREGLYYEDDDEEEYDRYSQNNRREERPRAALRKDRSEEDEERPSKRPVRDEEPEREIPKRRNEEERTVRPARNRRPEEDRQNRSARRERVEETEARSGRRDRDRGRDRDDDLEARAPRRDRDDYSRPSRRPDEDDRGRRPSPAPKRKARNFIGDEDDFEFEFLDLDDDK